jgi:hypothetical protein
LEEDFSEDDKQQWVGVVMAKKYDSEGNEEDTYIGI